MWCMRLRWRTVVDMSRYARGRNAFERFENARDEKYFVIHTQAENDRKRNDWNQRKDAADSAGNAEEAAAVSALENKN